MLDKKTPNQQILYAVCYRIDLMGDLFPELHWTVDFFFSPLRNENEISVHIIVPSC